MANEEKTEDRLEKTIIEALDGLIESNRVIAESNTYIRDLSNDYTTLKSENSRLEKICTNLYSENELLKTKLDLIYSEYFKAHIDIIWRDIALECLRSQIFDGASVGDMLVTINACRKGAVCDLSISGSFTDTEIYDKLAKLFAENWRKVKDGK